MLTTLTTPLRSVAAAAAAAAVDGVDPSPATRPRACVCLGAIERASTSDECLLSGISVTRGLIINIAGLGRGGVLQRIETRGLRIYGFNANARDGVVRGAHAIGHGT